MGTTIIIISTSKSTIQLVDFPAIVIMIGRNCETGKLFHKRLVWRSKEDQPFGVDVAIETVSLRGGK